MPLWSSMIGGGQKTERPQPPAHFSSSSALVTHTHARGAKFWCYHKPSFSEKYHSCSELATLLLYWILSLNATSYSESIFVINIMPLKKTPQTPGSHALRVKTSTSSRHSCFYTCQYLIFIGNITANANTDKAWSKPTPASTAKLIKLVTSC